MTRSRISGPLATALALAVSLALAAPQVLAQGFQSVFSRDGSDVWAVGDNGYAYRSLNGGDNWSINLLGNKALRAVAARGFTVIVVGDSGKIWRSVNSGGAWTLRVIAGAPSLRAIQWPADSAAYVVGAGGRILKSVDGGATWTAQISGTAVTLNAARFRDPIHGWAVGDGGVALRTDDGGQTWNTVALGTTALLRSVDALYNLVWIVGLDNTILRSFDGGLTWYPLDLKLDIPPDLRVVWIDRSDRIILTGGGGFLRVTADSGATWSFMQHPLIAPIDAMFFTQNPTRGWACSRAVLGLEYTLDGGATWSLVPATGFSGMQWVQKQGTAGVVRGATLNVNRANRNSIYAVLGAQMLKSLDRGETWNAIGTVAEGGYTPNRTNAFYVHPRDSTLMVAATQGPPDRILRSTDGGATWTHTLDVLFTEYGVPLEMNVDHPDTLLFAPEDGHLYRSLDFGATWDTLSTPDTLGVPIFRSPCDVQIVPGQNNNVWVSDGVTGVGQGAIWQSLDGGLTFAQRYPDPAYPPWSGSEVPILACPKLDHRIGLASHFPTGGMSRTFDGGQTWQQVTDTDAAWGIDFAHDDPTFATFATYGGQASFFSTDAGENFFYVALPAANYSLLAFDRSTILAQQSNGIYKFAPGYSTLVNNSQFLTLDAPGFGTSWPGGQVRNILWSPTNIAIARIDYRTSPAGPWILIADVPGYQASYSWTVPNVPTTTARVRIRDLWDDSPRDSSANFTIAVPAMAESPAALGFGTRAVGSATLDTLRITNTGTAALAINALSINAPGFTLGRTSLNLAPGESDTVGVTFRPALPGGYTATLTVASNAIGGAVQVPLSGAAIDTLHLTLTSPVGGEVWQYKTTRWIQWQSAMVSAISIDYETSAGAWIAIADSVPAAPGIHAWSVPYAPTDQARIRIRARGASATDSSAGPFFITSPQFAAVPSMLDLGVATVGTMVWDTLRVSNPGTGPIMISWITSDRAEIWPGRSWMTLTPGAGDSLTIFYRPMDAGRDTATITFVTNDPFTPHSVKVMGAGAPASDVQNARPAAFALMQNHPNPFAGRTAIRYALSARAAVLLEVFNLQGERVATLVHGEQEAGEYAVPFGAGAGGGGLPAGVYFYRLRAGLFESTRKMLMMR